MADIIEADRARLRAYMLERTERAFSGDPEPYAELLLRTLADHREATEAPIVAALRRAVSVKSDPRIDALIEAMLIYRGRRNRSRGA